MKSPADLAPQLRRQWADTPRRLRQLLAEESAWPVELPIPLPSAARLEGDLQAVREHVQAWRAVSVGEVQWEVRRYRSTANRCARSSRSPGLKYADNSSAPW